MKIINMAVLVCTALERTILPPKVEIKPSSTAALVGDTVVLQCFAHLIRKSNPGPILMRWTTPTRVGYISSQHTVLGVLHIYWQYT